MIKFIINVIITIIFVLVISVGLWMLRENMSNSNFELYGLSLISMFVFFAGYDNYSVCTICHIISCVSLLSIWVVDMSTQMSNKMSNKMSTQESTHTSKDIWFKFASIMVYALFVPLLLNIKFMN